MIVVRLTGGLGNQLFQYAIGRYLASRHGAELILEDSFYIDPPTGSTPRLYELDKYLINARRTDVAERRALRRYTGRITKRFHRLAQLPGPLIYIHERIGKFENQVRELPDGVFLDGYWQSEQYFSGINDILREEYVPLIPMSAEDERVKAQMAIGQSISLHIRRGDYVTNTAANVMHGVCGLDYYYRAIKYMAGKLVKPVFFIFSDDMKWVQDNMKIDFPCHYVKHNSTATAFQDLRLMSLCQHHIVANSSFSWWAAWLNPSVEKIVIRPKTWFAGLSQASAWACPQEWIPL